jgi:hypothetical protein
MVEVKDRKMGSYARTTHRRLRAEKLCGGDAARRSVIEGAMQYGESWRAPGGEFIGR